MVRALLAMLLLLAPLVGSEDGPDFAVLDAWVEPAEPAEGDAVVFHARIANLGGAGATWVGFILGEDEGGEAPYVHLASGEVKEVTSAWTATGHGLRVVRALADPSMLVAEPDETNNALDARFTVRAPDLTVTELAATPAPPPSVWGPTGIDIIVLNQGSAATRGDYTVQVIACPKTMPFEAFATCDPIAALDVPAGQAIDESRALRADWRIVGDLGGFTLCATIRAAPEQMRTDNDGRCIDAHAWAPLPRGVRVLS